MLRLWLKGKNSPAASCPSEEVGRLWTPQSMECTEDSKRLLALQSPAVTAICLSEVSDKGVVLLAIIQCNNQVRNEFEALWAVLCSLGQHSPVTELGHAFPSWWSLLCISLPGLDSGLSCGSVHLFTSCTVGLQQHQESLCYSLGLCTPPFQLLSSTGAALLLKAQVSTKNIALDLQCDTAIPACPCWLPSEEWLLCLLSPGKLDCQIHPALLPLLGGILAINPYKASPVLLSSLQLVAVFDGLEPLPAACNLFEQRILEAVWG